MRTRCLMTTWLCVVFSGTSTVCAVPEDLDLPAFEAAVHEQLAAGEYADVQALARSVISKAPDSHAMLRAKTALAKAYICGDQFQSAETLTAELIHESSSDPDLVRTLCEIGDTWKTKEQVDRARSVYERAVDDFGSFPFAVWAQKNLCTLHLESKDRQSAQRATDDLLAAFAENPDVNQAICSVGDAWLRCGDTAKAIELYEHVVKNYPDATYSIWSQKNLCTLYARMNNEAVSAAEIETLKTVFAANSHISQALCEVGDAWLRGGDTGKAIGLYEYVVASYPAAPHSIWSQKNLCSVYASIGSETAGDAALDKLKAQFEKHSSIGLALCGAADAWQRVGMHEKALGIYRYVLERYPKNADVIWSQKGLAVSEVYGSSDPNTHPELDKLLDGYANHPTLPAASFLVAEEYRNRAVSAENEGNCNAQDYYFLAAKIWHQVISKVPESVYTPESHFQLAECCFKSGGYSEAFQQYQHVVSNWPRSRFGAHAQFMLGYRMNQLSGRNGLDLAQVRAYTQAAYQKMVADYPTDPLSQVATAWLNNQSY